MHGCSGVPVSVFKSDEVLLLPTGALCLRVYRLLADGGIRISDVSEGLEYNRFVTETRRHFVEKDPRDIEGMVHAGDARRFSAFDRVKASRESWD